MSTILKQKIQEYIDAQRYSIRELERQTGLGSNTIHNILSDRSKSPTIETVIKIADALNCSLDELLDRKKFTNHKQKRLSNSTFALDIKLFQDICIFINEFIETNATSDLKLTDAVFYIEEIYKYCFSNTSKQFNEEFAKWFLKRQLDDPENF